MFGLGKDTSLEDEVPGTINLVDMEGLLDVEKGENGNIILHPPPSSDINDPLRWLRWKKEYQLYLLTFWGFIQSVSTIWSGPIWDLWVEMFGCTYNQLNIMSGLCFVFIAVGCVTLQPCALKLGKRFVYLICTLFQIIGNVIYAKATGVNHLYAASAFVGFGSAPMYSLIEISVMDFYFQHQRASKISYLVFALYGGVALGPLAAGYVTDGLGWKWCPYIMVIIFSVTFIVQFFTMEDTTFRRVETPEDFQTVILEQIKSRESQALDLGKSHPSRVEVELHEDDDSSIDQSIPKRPYWNRMNIFSLAHADPRSWFWVIFKPFWLASFPAVVWCGILQAVQQMWLTLISSTQAQFYSEPPYNFGNSAIGLTNLSTFVGIILGLWYGGWFVDKVTLYLSRKNNGIMEPEFRLWNMVIPVGINVCGLLSYGLGFLNKVHWAVPCILGQGSLGFSMAAVTGIAYTYCSDSYPNLVGEGIVFISFINNAVATVFTFFISDWMDRDGLVLMTWLLFLIAMVVNGSFLAFTIWGKQARRMTKHLYYRICDLGEVKSSSSHL